MFHDDDDDLPSQSSAEYLTRADHGKKEKQERNAAKKDLLSLKRSVLKQQVKGRQNAPQNKEDASSQDNKGEEMGTKTTQEVIQQQTQDAQSRETEETLIHKAQQQQQAKEQSPQEYQQEQSS